MTPTEKHIEAAWGVFGPNPRAVVRTPQRKVLVLAIAAALANAEREGMEAERKRCAEIAKAKMHEVHFMTFQQAHGWVGIEEAIVAAILSEAGEGA